jgi:hypothetical protein
MPNGAILKLSLGDTSGFHSKPPVFGSSKMRAAESCLVDHRRDAVFPKIRGKKTKV